MGDFQEIFGEAEKVVVDLVVAAERVIKNQRKWQKGERGKKEEAKMGWEIAFKFIHSRDQAENICIVLLLHVIVSEVFRGAEEFQINEGEREDEKE